MPGFRGILNLFGLWFDTSLTVPEDPYLPTGIPCLTQICWEYSATREDFLLLNSETANGNVQQVTAAFAGEVPYGAAVLTGATSSDADNWSEFYSNQQPEVEESHNIVLLDRQEDNESIVQKETLTTKDGWTFTTDYGRWSETGSITIYEIDSDGNEVTISSENYQPYTRSGLIIMNRRYSLDKKLYMSIVNENKLKVGLKLSNSNHEEPITIEGVGFMYSTNRVRPPALSQVPPRVTQVAINPSNPMTTSTFSVSYRYIDLNRNDESGTLLRWYKNGTPLFEINNLTTWNDDNLLQSNKLKADDVISVAITPSDGFDMGTTVFSPSVKIGVIPPTPTQAKLLSLRQGVLNSRTDTSSVITVDYDYTPPKGTVEQGTKIDWYVNGLLYKTVTYSAGDDEYIKKSLFPFEQPTKYDDQGNVIETVNDITIYNIGNTIYSLVTLQNSGITGESVRTESVTIQNSIPIVKDIQITPLNPSVQSTLSLSYIFDDADIVLSSQTDQTEKHWYKSIDGSVFSEVTELRDALLVSPSYLKAGEHWRVKLIPYDGLEFGKEQTSVTVIILPT